MYMYCKTSLKCHYKTINTMIYRMDVFLYQLRPRSQIDTTPAGELLFVFTSVGCDLCSDWLMKGYTKLFSNMGIV